MCWPLLFLSDLQALKSKGDGSSPEDKIKNEARFSRLFHSTILLRCRRVLLVGTISTNYWLVTLFHLELSLGACEASLGYLSAQDSP